MVTPTQIPVTQFPHEEDLLITIRIRTQDENDREYFFTTENEIQPGFLADVFDSFDQIRNHIVTVNGKTLKEILKILQSSR